MEQGKSLSLFYVRLSQTFSGIPPQKCQALSSTILPSQFDFSFELVMDAVCACDVHELDYVFWQHQVFFNQLLSFTKIFFFQQRELAYHRWYMYHTSKIVVLCSMIQCYRSCDELHELHPNVFGYFVVADVHLNKPISLPASTYSPDPSII